MMFVLSAIWAVAALLLAAVLSNGVEATNRNLCELTNRYLPDISAECDGIGFFVRLAVYLTAAALLTSFAIFVFKRARGSTAAPRLKISCGEDGQYIRTSGAHLYGTYRTLCLKIENVSQDATVTDIRVIVEDIFPREWREGPWTLAKGLTLAAGDHAFISLATHQEARDDHGASYSTTRFERSDSVFRVQAEKNAPLLGREAYFLFRMKATGIGASPTNFQCVVWVSAPDGRIRIRKGGAFTVMLINLYRSRFVFRRKLKR